MLSDSCDCSRISAQWRLTLRPFSLALWNSLLNDSKSPTLGSPLSSRPTRYYPFWSCLALIAKSTVSAHSSTPYALLTLAKNVTFMFWQMSFISWMTLSTVCKYISFELICPACLGVDRNSKYRVFCFA